MHILPVLAGLEVLAPGGRPGIFFFVHLNCASNVGLLAMPEPSGAFKGGELVQS